MIELLQDLWNEYEEVIDTLTNLLEDVEYQTDAVKIIKAMTTMTPEISNLRARLIRAGVKMENPN